MRRYLRFIITLCLVLPTNFIDAKFVQTKNGFQVIVKGLASHEDIRLIGDTVGRRRIKELKECNIYPVRLTFKNKSDACVFIRPQNLRLKKWGIFGLKWALPKSLFFKRENIFILVWSLVNDTFNLVGKLNDFIWENFYTPWIVVTFLFYLLQSSEDIPSKRLKKKLDPQYNYHPNY